MKQTPVSKAHAHATMDHFIVWLVEDNERFRSSIAELINTTENLRCEKTFPTCEAALAALEETDAPEVVLMDIGLPGMDGIEGTKRVKRLSPSTEVILLTVYDDDERVFRAICGGATGYLLKDADAAGVLAAIRDVLQGGAPVNAQIARRMLDMFSKLAVPQAEYGLTRRERDILHHLVDGLTKQQIAEKLFLSFHTIDTHLKNIYAKLQVHSRTGAVAKVLKERLL